MQNQGDQTSTMSTSENSEKTPLKTEQGPPYNGTDYSGGGATVTMAPQFVSFPTPNGPPPDDYLVMSILTIIFCFWPLGIVALLKSLEVRNAIARGDYTTAQVASRSAYKFNKLSIFVGIVISVIVVVLVLISQLFWIIPVATFPRE